MGNTSNQNHPKSDQTWAYG